MTILAAVEGKHVPSRIIEVGHSLATEFDETLVVLHVGDDEMSESDAAFIARDVTTKSIGESDIVEAVGRIGHPDEEILQEVEERNPRYLLTGGRKRSAVGKAVFGSVSQSLLLNSTCPVIAVPHDGLPVDALSHGPVVAAVDRSDRASHVVEEAKVLADTLGRELHVLHVFPTKEWLNLHRERVEATGSQGVDKDVVRESALEIAQNAGNAVSDDFTPIGKVGDPSNGIFQYVSEVDASYVALAGRKRTPVGKVLFGSVTQSVILNLDRPALTTMHD